MGKSTVYVADYPKHGISKYHNMSIWKFILRDYNRIPVLILGESFHSKDFISDDKLSENHIYLIRPEYGGEIVNIVKGLSLDSKNKTSHDPDFVKLIVYTSVKDGTYYGCYNANEIRSELLRNGIDVFVLDYKDGKTILEYFINPCLPTLKGNVSTFLPFQDHDLVILGSVSIDDVITHIEKMVNLYNRIYDHTFEDMYDGFYKFYIKLLKEYGIYDYKDGKDPVVKKCITEIKRTNRIRYIYRLSTLFRVPDLVNRMINMPLCDYDLI